MAKEKFNRADCVSLLIQKREQLNSLGESRYPRRSDFTDEEVNAIKAFLGPWPRALEAAGLKPPRDDNRTRLNLEKRVRAKRRRTEAKKQAQSDSKAAASEKAGSDNSD